jgi:copper chaperone NosL
VFACASLGLMGASACATPGPPGPPEIRLGIDACAGCGMAIADTRYAAAAIAINGEETRTLKFDDIGCLARWAAASNEPTRCKSWVHDRGTGAWIDTDAAAFVQLGDLVTPMGSGIVAFDKTSDAEAAGADRAGRLLSWAAVLAEARVEALPAQPRPPRETAR